MKTSGRRRVHDTERECMGGVGQGNAVEIGSRIAKNGMPSVEVATENCVGVIAKKIEKKCIGTREPVWNITGGNAVPYFAQLAFHEDDVEGGAKTRYITYWNTRTNEYCHAAASVLDVAPEYVKTIAAEIHLNRQFGFLDEKYVATRRMNEIVKKSAAIRSHQGVDINGNDFVRHY